MLLLCSFDSDFAESEDAANNTLSGNGNYLNAGPHNMEQHNVNQDNNYQQHNALVLEPLNNNMDLENACQDQSNIEVEQKRERGDQPRSEENNVENTQLAILNQGEY